jgi:hypothetical protein
MSKMLIGQETEFFLSVIGNEKQINRSAVVDQFFREARKLPHLPSPQHDCGIFLINGGYLYRDCGEHIEAATVECCNPWDLLNNKLALEHIMSKFCDDIIRKNSDISELVLSKVNVDYTGYASTWGEHESYLTHKETRRFDEQQLVPHLVSRILYTGAGGWHSASPGLLFLISPRVPFYTHVVSKDSTQFRGIFHTKDESLAGSKYKYKRIHVICGEGLFSHKASLLKTGVTALVVRLIDCGLKPGEEVRLHSPLDAINTFARDIDCNAAVRIVSGEALTAVDIQRHYLAQVMQHMEKMPAWAPKICSMWEETLDDLETNPRGLNRVLDWPSKFEIFSQYIISHGYSWDEIEAWNRLLKELNDIKDPKRDINPISNWLKRDTLASDTLQYHQIIKKHCLEPSRFRNFLKLRDELYEIDIRCEQIGKKGIFSMLDHQGIFRHHVDGINDETVEDAKENPPHGSRARIRGECIKRLSLNSNRYHCYWTHIQDLQTNKILNLYDPFEKNERWEDSLKRNEASVYDL